MLLTELLGADSWSGGAGLQWWWAASECHVVRCSWIGEPHSKPEEEEYANANDGTATKDKEEHCDSCGAVVKRQDERPHECAHKAIELKGCKELLSGGTYNERERHGKSVRWLLYYLVVATAAAYQSVEARCGLLSVTGVTCCMTNGTATQIDLQQCASVREVAWASNQM